MDSSGVAHKDMRLKPLQRTMCLTQIRWFKKADRPTCTKVKFCYPANDRTTGRLVFFEQALEQLYFFALAFEQPFVELHNLFYRV